MIRVKTGGMCTRSVLTQMSLSRFVPFGVPFYLIFFASLLDEFDVVSNVLAAFYTVE